MVLLPRIQTVWRSDFDEPLLRELHELAEKLMAESYEHFSVHARSNDAVHVFRSEGALVGFQFWRCIAMAEPRTRAVVGGKLRIAPEHRRRGLHLASALLFYAQTKRRWPRCRLYRLSIASIFGFVAISEALADYRFLDASSPEVVRRAFRDIAEESHYVLSEEDFCIFVDIRMTEATLARYPDAYFAREAARAYTQKNPGYRDNGKYLGFWFRFTPRNLLSMTRAVLRRSLGGPPTARGREDRQDAGAAVASSIHVPASGKRPSSQSETPPS